MPTRSGSAPAWRRPGSWCQARRSTDDQITDHLAVFYQLIRESKTVTVTGEYASAVVRRFFDVRSPVAQYARIPRSYVILQRINLGLFALLGEMKATANWRAIAEEIWPFMQAPPSTPMGTAELPWLASQGLAVRLTNGSNVKVLITGGAGYIGSTIASACLDAGIAPVILDSLVTGRQEFARGP